MSRWVKIYKNRDWRNQQAIDVDKILRIVDYGTFTLEIIYPHGIFTKSFFINYTKDTDEYRFFKNIEELK